MFVGLAILRVHHPAPQVDPPLEVDVVIEPPPPLPDPPPTRDVDWGVRNAKHADAVPTRTHDSVTHDVQGEAIRDENAPKPIDAQPIVTSTNDEHECESGDCVLESLERCRLGDGDACVGVGLYYERGRGDPFSAIKWYVRGCTLSSPTACAASDRVSHAMPLGWDHHPLYLPSPT
jgi:hypothetical protein